MQIKSYNQILAVLQDIATRHYQINSFYVGASWEIAASDSPEYPLLAVKPIAASMKRGSNAAYSAFEVNIELKVLDAVNKGESNEDDVQSDTLQMLQDIITEFSSHPYYTESKFDLIGDLSFDPLDEVTDDQTNGWSVSLLMRTPYQTAFCGTPIADIPGFSFPDLPNGGGNDICLCVKSITGSDSITITHDPNGHYLWEINPDFLINNPSPPAVQLPFIFSNISVNSVIPSFGAYNDVNATAITSTILGGNYNQIGSTTSNSTILNGTYNIIQNTSTESVILAGNSNNIRNASRTSIIGAGKSNDISNSIYGFIGNGFGNNILNSNYGTIVNGKTNSISDSNLSSIIGGQNNNIVGSTFNNPEQSFIGGGQGNQIKGGGTLNTPNQAIVSGLYNQITIQSSFYGPIVPVKTTLIPGLNGQFIGGGVGIKVSNQSEYSGILCGLNNQINDDSKFSAIVGGSENLIHSTYGFIGGGMKHVINTKLGYGSGNVIVGGGYSEDGNSITAQAGKQCFLNGIVGGNKNDITDNNYSFIGGGHINVITASNEASILGGYNNSILNTSIRSAIIGGTDNTIQTIASYSIIGAGESNTITTAKHSIIGSGFTNTITSSNKAAILSGFTNTIQTNSTYGLIGNGESNTITNSPRSSILNGQNARIINSKDALVLTAPSDGTVWGYINDSKYSIISGFNRIKSKASYGGSLLIGGWYNSSETSDYINIIGGSYNNVIGSTYCTILGGDGSGTGNTITTANHCTIIGAQNTITSFDNVHIIGSNITAGTSNTVYVENLNIDQAPGTATTDDVLVRESSGDIYLRSGASLNSSMTVSSNLTTSTTTYLVQSNTNLVFLGSDKVGQPTSATFATYLTVFATGGSIRIRDKTNANALICEITGISSTSIGNLETTTTFTNVSTGPAVWQIEYKAGTGDTIKWRGVNILFG